MPQEAWHRAVLPRQQSPFSPFCPHHLRRICGNCKHFGGDLRGNPSVARECARYGVAKVPAARASNCPAWERDWDGGAA